MLIENVRTIRTDNPHRYGWSSLARFHNVKYTTEILVELHGIPERHLENARKQATHIRYCLIQAKEYADAAKSVSLSTRPLLYYYSVMSLALAEILLKGTGDHSLDRARGDNAHHGLTLRGSDQMKADLPLAEAAERLFASPMVMANGTRRGTFHLWHRASRGLPMCGEFEHQLPDAKFTDIRTLAGPSDEPPPAISEEGVTLLECYKSLPCMQEFLLHNNILGSLARAKARSSQDSSGNINLSIIIQPTHRDVLEKLYERFQFRTANFDQIQVVDLQSGCIIRHKSGPDWPMDPTKLPGSVQINAREIYLDSSDRPLNEFGYYYYALYILGNYARYFPDKWMRDVENHSPLALSAEELIQGCEDRVALLSLSELSRTSCLIE